MKILGEHLSRLRKENNRSYKEVAVDLQITCQELANWETGQVRPTIRDLRKLSEIYDVSLESMIGHKKLTIEKTSDILEECVGAKGILYLKNVQYQPFYPTCVVKNVLILEVKAGSMKIRIDDKAVICQTIYI